MHKSKDTEYWLGRPLMNNRTVDPECGKLTTAETACTHFEPVWLQQGSRVQARNGAAFLLAYYAPEVKDELLHTYCYAEEANWTTFDPLHSQLDRWITGDKVITVSGYYRIIFERCVPDDYCLLDPYGEQIKTVDQADRVRPLGVSVPEETRLEELAEDLWPVRDEQLRFLLLTDTHYSAGCPWMETIASLTRVEKRCHPDGIIHLGDLTDGLADRENAVLMTRRMLLDMKQVNRNLYLCLGNHDTNYFRGNPDPVTPADAAKLYNGSRGRWYFVDYREAAIRMVFLESFDHRRKERYGFALREYLWFRRTLKTTPKGWKLLIFSHVTPDAAMHVWSDTILNGERMLQAAERFASDRPGDLLGWICGHNHADQIKYRGGVPIISIGCSKPEDFQDHKPEGAVTYQRDLNNAARELWDLLEIDTKESRLVFHRIGAGVDRSVESVGTGPLTYTGERES